MIKYMWRQMFLSIVIFWAIIVTFGCILFLISDPQKILDSLPLVIGCMLSGIVSFICLMSLGLSNTEFIEILKNNGFVAEYKIISRLLFNIKGFVGLRNDSILIYACFFGRYWPSIEDLLRSTGTSTINLKFYFPCKTTAEIDHYIVKLGDKIKIGPHNSLFRDNGGINKTDADLATIISEISTDLDFLIVNHLQLKQGYVLITTGPASLAYGEYAKKNIPAVLKFINAFRKYYGCQDEKWDRQIDVSNLKENIDALNKEFVHSLREKYKNK